MRHLLPLLLLVPVACSGGDAATSSDGGSTGPSSGDDTGGTVVTLPDGGTVIVLPDGGVAPPPKDAGAKDSGAKDSGGGVKDSGPPPPPNDGSALDVYGPVHTGGEYQLGPVEWTGSFWNECAPYAPAVETMEGIYLAGLDSKYQDGSLCDVCVLMNTAKGKSIVLRVVTGGQASSPESMDISQEAYNAVNLNEEPRSMTWQLVKCPATGKIQYQYQTGANTDWTSLWVRNARVPITKVEVMSSHHAAWTALTRASDGTLTDGSGFGPGAFQIRLTGMDGQVVTDSFASFTAGALVASPNQFN